MLNEFKTFIARGNVVGPGGRVIIGAAFGGVVTSLVNDVIMRRSAGCSRRGLQGFLREPHEPVVSDARRREGSGRPDAQLRLFFNTLINFLIVSSAIFLLVRQVNHLFPKPAPPAAPAIKECVWCVTRFRRRQALPACPRT